MKEPSSFLIDDMAAFLCFSRLIMLAAFWREDDVLEQCFCQLFLLAFLINFTYLLLRFYGPLDRSAHRIVSICSSSA